ncbi:MAG: methylmalonyl Co-A mutase-associated GTPase MeaB, partial [Spirochaetota bacterium]
MYDVASLVSGIRNGDPRSIARSITMVEREDPARLAVLKAINTDTGQAHIVGITGPPGAGKSTLTDKLLGELRSRGRRVAVAAIDPSSPFTGGAILGDRIRMQRHADDDGVFIRSLATRGHLGGLSRATAETVRIFDAAGFDDIIIETVGVGQSEVDIVRLADTVVLVSVPGLGDDIQAIKAGVMEIGDVFCVNKADRDGSERVIREIRAMLEAAVMNGAVTRFSALYQALGRFKADATTEDQSAPRASSAGLFDQGAAHHIARQPPGHDALEIPAVIPTTAETGYGVSRLVDEIKAHESALVATGFLRMRRHENLSWELGNALADRVLRRLEGEDRKAELADLASAVLDKRRDFYE